MSIQEAINHGYRFDAGGKPKLGDTIQFRVPPKFKPSTDKDLTIAAIRVLNPRLYTELILSGQIRDVDETILVTIQSEEDLQLIREAIY